MKCKVCGNELDVNSPHCVRCGTPISPEDIQKIKEEMYLKEILSSGGREDNISGDSQSTNTMETTDTGRKRIGTGKKYLIGTMLLFIVVLIAGIEIGLRFYYNSKDESLEATQKDSTSFTANSIGLESQTALETDKKGDIDEREAEETIIDETEASLVELDYIGNDYMNYPLSPDDFVEVSGADGKYSFVYPKGVFKTGYYNLNTKTYYFEASDGITSLEIKQEDAIIKNDPMNCANTLLSNYYSEFQTNLDSFYTYASKQVAESGYSRSVIAGVLKNS